MQTNDMPRFFRHGVCQALTDLTLSQLPRDGALGAEQRHVKGTSIWHPDELADSVFFLRRGKVEVLVDDLDGKEVLLQQIESGELFGELCVCSGKDSIRFTHARAVDESEVLRVKLPDFLDYLSRNNTALESLVFTFCKRLAAAENQIHVLSHRGADDRLGQLLLQLALPKEIKGELLPTEAMVRVSHVELAKMAAMSRPHVTVTMLKFRQLGLVRYGQNQPLTVAVAALRAYLTGEQTGTMT